MEVFGNDMRVCGVDENMVRDWKGWRGKMRTAEPTYVE